MSDKKDNGSKTESDLYSGWAAMKQDHTFYSNSCKATPIGTPSPFAREVEKRRQHAPGNNNI